PRAISNLLRQRLKRVGDVQKVLFVVLGLAAAEFAGGVGRLHRLEAGVLGQHHAEDAYCVVAHGHFSGFSPIHSTWMAAGSFGGSFRVAATMNCTASCVAIHFSTGPRAAGCSRSNSSTMHSPWVRDASA